MTIKTLGIAAGKRAAVLAHGHIYNGYGDTIQVATHDAIGRAAVGAHCRHVYALLVGSRLKKCKQCSGQLKDKFTSV